MTGPVNSAAAAAIGGWANTINTVWEAQQRLADAPAAAKKPVIIVAGTELPASFYTPLADHLRGNGYQVFVYELPDRGRVEVERSARELAAFTEQIRQQTGTDKVDLVGHSQGGLVARQFVKVDGGADKVRNLIGLGVPNHGTSLANATDLLSVFGLAPAVGLYPAYAEMQPDSQFLKQLNEGDDTIGDVRYTNIYTDRDKFVLPADSAVMEDGATNVRIQSQLPDSKVGHEALPNDPAVRNGILDALRGEPIDLTK